jgi:hypothetical protein
MVARGKIGKPYGRAGDGAITFWSRVFRVSSTSRLSSRPEHQTLEATHEKTRHAKCRMPVELARRRRRR